MSLNLFDKIIYINLEKRKDRNKSVLNELKLKDVNDSRIFRLNARIDEFNGARAAVNSHIEALNYAIEKNFEKVLILEDDVSFYSDKDFFNKTVKDFFNNFENNWDVFLVGAQLSLCEKTKHSDYVRVKIAQHAHAYAVNKKYLKVLRNCFIDAYNSMLQDLLFIQSISKNTDQAWKALQIKDKWYMPKINLAIQNDEYSDIEKCKKIRTYDSNIEAIKLCEDLN